MGGSAREQRLKQRQTGYQALHTPPVLHQQRHIQDGGRRAHLLGDVHGLLAQPRGYVAAQLTQWGMRRRRQGGSDVVGLRAGPHPRNGPWQSACSRTWEEGYCPPQGNARAQHRYADLALAGILIGHGIAFDRLVAGQSTFKPAGLARRKRQNKR